MKTLTTIILSLITVAALFAPGCAKSSGTQVLIETNLGTIKVELFDKESPKTVKNFLEYVDSGFYNGTIFHRVISGFMIQCGGLTPDMQQKKTKDPIQNEANNKIKNTRGTLAMARTQSVHSATSQFFINTADNIFLDYGVRDYGYCVFGKVISGMDIVEKIEAVKTETKGFNADVPSEPVIIISIKRVK